MTIIKTVMAAATLAILSFPLATTEASAHGCHRSIQLGGAGWHYHVGPGCRRIAAAGPRRYYGARCYERCRYVGPIKQCDRVCR